MRLNTLAQPLLCLWQSSIQHRQRRALLENWARTLQKNEKQSWTPATYRTDVAAASALNFSLVSLIRNVQNHIAHLEMLHGSSGTEVTG